MTREERLRGLLDELEAAVRDRGDGARRAAAARAEIHALIAPPAVPPGVLVVDESDGRYTRYGDRGAGS